MTPLVFGILASRTPPDIELNLYDERLEAIPYDVPTDLVAMTVETYTARRAYQIAAEFRRRGVKVVMGGYHPTFLPNEALQFADAVVQGDAETVWERIVADATKGRLMNLYRQDGFPSLDGSTLDRTIFEGKAYVPITLIQYGRGCRYNCEFCSIRAFYGSNLRQRPAHKVVEEIERLGRKHVFFVDDNLFVNIQKARELFEALIPLRIAWSCQITIDIAKDRDLIRLMERSGCITALIGFESLNADNLRQMKKQWNLRYGDYATTIKMIQDAGIMIYGTFVFGYDQDTADSFDLAVDFAIRNRFYLANFNPLTPTPAAPLLERLKMEQRLLYDRWWLEPGYHYGEATFHPRGMTAEDLTAGCYRARSEFNTYSSILRRMVAPRTNCRSPYRLLVYLLSNIISRKEIHAKQGLPLGEPMVLEPLLEGR